MTSQKKTAKLLKAKKRGFTDLAWFAKTFFPERFREKFSVMHRELFQLIKPTGLSSKRVLIAAPRGHAKTTIMLTLKVLHAICYRTEKYIVIVGQSETEAQAKVEQILEELRQNPRLKAVFGDLTPPRGYGGKAGFVTRNGIKVQAISKGQSIRGLQYKGHRPTLVILDDVETLEGVQKPEQREKTLAWFNKDIIPAGEVDGSTKFYVIGTLLHDASLLATLMNQPRWCTRRYQAILSYATDQPLWDQWQALYTDLSNPSREQTADKFFDANKEVMLTGTAVLWPEVEPYINLMKLKVELGSEAFGSEKQNEPHDPSKRIFSMANAHQFSWTEETQTLECMTRERSLQRQDLHTVVAFHDPATGESDHGDYAAIVVVGKDYDGYMYVLDAFIKRCLPDAQIEAAKRLHTRWGFDTLYIEANGFQATLWHTYRKRFEGVHNAPRIQCHTQSGDKTLRLAALQPYIANGHLLFREDLDPKLFQQLTYFPTATHDDGPDALEGAVHQLITRRPLGRPSLGPRRKIDRPL